MKFDSSELTLDLVHILELIDKPENLSKCQGLFIKLNQCEAEYKKLVQENRSLLEGPEAECLEAEENALETITKNKEAFNERIRAHLKEFNL